MMSGEFATFYNADDWYIGEDWFCLCPCVHCEALVMCRGFRDAYPSGTVLTIEMIEDHIVSRIDVGSHSDPRFLESVMAEWPHEVDCLGRGEGEPANIDEYEAELMLEVINGIERSLGFPPHMWPTVKVGDRVA